MDRVKPGERLRKNKKKEVSVLLTCQEAKTVDATTVTYPATPRTRARETREKIHLVEQ
jgi:hypothetical protein